MAVYKTSIQESGVKQFSKNQLKLSSIAYLTTGLGLLITFACALIFAKVFENADAQTNDILAIVATISLLVSLILSIVWSFRVMKASMIFRIMTILLYCVANGIGFGSLFVAIGYSEIVASFGITAVICGICFIASRFMTDRMAMTLSKMIMVMWMVYFVIAITTFFTWIFGFNGGSFNNVANVIITILTSLILLAVMTYQMWMISRMDEFVTDTNQSLAFGMFLGFVLLMSIIQIVYRIIFLLQYIKR